MKLKYSLEHLASYLVKKIKKLSFLKGRTKNSYRRCFGKFRHSLIQLKFISTCMDWNWHSKEKSTTRLLRVDINSQQWNKQRIVGEQSILLFSIFYKFSFLLKVITDDSTIYSSTMFWMLCARTVSAKQLTRLLLCKSGMFLNLARNIT